MKNASSRNRVIPVAVCDQEGTSLEQQGWGQTGSWGDLQVLASWETSPGDFHGKSMGQEAVLVSQVTSRAFNFLSLEKGNEVGWVCLSVFHGTWRFLGDPSEIDTEVKAKAKAWAVPPPPAPHPNHSSSMPIKFKHWTIL